MSKEMMMFLWEIFCIISAATFLGVEFGRNVGFAVALLTIVFLCHPQQ